MVREQGIVERSIGKNVLRPQDLGLIDSCLKIQPHDERKLLGGCTFCEFLSQTIIVKSLSKNGGLELPYYLNCLEYCVFSEYCVQRMVVHKQACLLIVMLELQTIILIIIPIIVMLKLQQ